MSGVRSPLRWTVPAAVVTLTLLWPPAAIAEDSVGVMMVAHRGSVGHAPEHTLASIDQAVADHADRVGIDIRLSRDGVPVMVHDRFLNRTTNVEQVFPGRSPWRVADFTLSEMRRLDAGSWYAGGGYTGSRVLTLNQVLTELADSPVGMTLEAKQPPLYGGVPGIGAAIMSVLDRHPEWTAANANGDPRLVLESFAWTFLDGMHAAYGAQPLVLLGDTVTPADVAARPWASEVDVRHQNLTAELVESATALGMRVGAWVANTTAELQRAIDLDADALATDEPHRLSAMLRVQGRTWTGTTWPAVRRTLQVRVSAPSTASVGGRVAVRAEAVDASGTPIRWQGVTFQSRVAGAWRTVSGNATDSRGWSASSLAMNDNMRFRAVSKGRVSAVRAVAAVTTRVSLPARAPAPSRHLRAQPRPTTSGSAPRVARVSASTWRAMTGRSWRRGCPVGRAGLRTVRVSYWGFDGQRHRGELVVARGSAHQVARVFRRLYGERLRVRSLHRLESLGPYRGAVTRALRAGASFGYACQRVPGDRWRLGSHARGTVLTVNPWENPTRVSGRGAPNSWWLSRRRERGYVHRPGSAVLRAFAAEGFAWNGRYGKYADFRDVR